MNQLFKRTAVRPNRPWMRLMDVEPVQLDQWNQRFQYTRLQPSTSMLFVRENMLRMKWELERYRSLIRLVREQVEHLPQQSYQIHIFMLTDAQGKVIDIIGDDETLQLLHKQNVGVGTSFAMEHAGINAFSVSMELDCPVVIEGPEHHLQMFSEWTCVCAPIKQNGNTIAYLDISFGCGIDVSFSALLLDQVVKRVEAGLQQNDPELHMNRVYERFSDYGLTPREKEIGYRWLVNQTTAQIAAELYLSEGTVRNMVKKVYVKTEVNSRGSYIHKFLV